MRGFNKQILIAVLIAYPILVSSQVYRYGSSYKENHFGFTAEAGVTTFFGDIDDGAAQGKLSNNLAYKIRANWNLSHVFDISGRISIGKISGEKKRSSGGNTSYNYFYTSFIEYTFDFGINILAPILKEKRDKFELYLTVGFGLNDFKVKLYDGSNDSIIQSYGYDGNKSTTEFVLPIGGRAIYNINSTHAVTLQNTLSQVDTDKLDGKTGNDNSDFYNYFSVGYTYKIPTSKGGKRPKGGRLNNYRPKYRR